MKAGIILYGPPAAGKSSVTRELQNLDQRFELFRRMKTGRGRSSEYRMVTPEDIQEAHRRGEVVWQNERYGSVYVIDRPGLVAMMEDRIPVVHLGQAEGVLAVLTAVPACWLVAYLWCPREVALSRIRERATGDTEERVRVWDETPELPTADLIVDTSMTAISEVAKRVESSLPR
ncbi:hypothetical protein [Nocardiopsis sp. CNT312]|uniref:hypothetical protein n=1 Tax=Nocardiopsis sp. CNT312 TaxID=1137268 RepID=UPI000491C5F0|nr:hypothetical protein [Nocardiopsis sp. CNT312]